MRRVTSLRSNRIRTDYVNRMAQSQNVEKIERVARITETKTPLRQPSENYLLSYDHFYKQRQELKLEFKRFYYHEQAFFNAIKTLDKGDTHILSHTDQLIDKYNNALLAVIDFDKIAGTDHSSAIRAVFQSFSEAFSKIGVFETEEGLLNLDPRRFIAFLKESEDSVRTFITTFKRMVLKEYRSFFAIRLPVQKGNPYEQPIFSIKGLIVEDIG